MSENVTFYSGQKSDKSTEALRRSGSIFIANGHTCLNPTQFSSPLDACASVTCVELHQVQQRHADSKAKRDIHFGRKKAVVDDVDGWNADGGGGGAVYALCVAKSLIWVQQLSQL